MGGDIADTRNGNLKSKSSESFSGLASADESFSTSCDLMLFVWRGDFDLLS